MLVATVFGIIFVPAIYTIFQRLREWVRRDKTKKTQIPNKEADVADEGRKEGEE
jgi:hypothetical protein